MSPYSIFPSPIGSSTRTSIEKFQSLLRTFFYEQGTATVLFIVFLGVVAALIAAGASLAHAFAALTVVYVFGFITGSLLVKPGDGETLALAVVKLLAGLLLSTVGFFLSLLLSLPWWAGPVALFSCAVVAHGRAAFAPPVSRFTFSKSGLLAGLLGVALLAPILVTAILMSPGEYPPVFFNVDTPYFLEKVHALVKTEAFPPESLSFVGGLHTYHFGIHGLTALIARTSGLAPHHALFLIALPLLTMAVLAAAITAARSISPGLPIWVSVPMLLISVPTLWYPFWATVGPPLLSAAFSFDLGSLDSLTDRYQMWGAASNNGQNIATHFIVLASLAGIALAPTRGWRLPIFLIGSAIMFKIPAGVALVAGFSGAQAYRAIAMKSLRPLIPPLAAATVFALTYGLFWVAPSVSAAEVNLEPSPFFHLRLLARREILLGFGLDMIWLFLPAGIVFLTGLKDPEKRSLPLLCFALVPLVLVNTLTLVGTGDFEDDWPQVLLAVPLVVHAFVLSLAGQRWTRLSRGVQAVFLAVVALNVLPPTLVAAGYVRLLIVNPERGHEFVDNRLLAEALSAIPVDGAIIVTNDLRYPAEGFSRNDRQMQIPALFGHQAFAVNFAYETYPFSDERLEAQNLLRAAEYSEAIDQAARTYQWTHLLIRNDYMHPTLIPLKRIFDNGTYSVFRFSSS